MTIPRRKEDGLAQAALATGMSQDAGEARDRPAPAEPPPPEGLVLQRDLESWLVDATPFAAVVFATRSVSRLRGKYRVPGEVGEGTPLAQIRYVEALDRLLLAGLGACRFDAASDAPTARDLLVQVRSIPGDLEIEASEYRELLIRYLANPRAANDIEAGILAASVCQQTAGIAADGEDDPQYWQAAVTASLRGDLRSLRKIPLRDLEQGPFDVGPHGPLGNPWPFETPRWYRAPERLTIERGLLHSRKVREKIERRAEGIDDQDLAELAQPRVEPELQPEVERFNRLEAEVAELRRAIVEKFQAHLDAVHELRNLGDFDQNKALAKRIAVFAKEHGISLTYDGRPVYLRLSTGGANRIGAFQLIAADERNKLRYHNDQFPQLVAVSKPDRGD